MTSDDLAHVTTAADRLGWTLGGCRWLSMIARCNDDRCAKVARVALHRAASEGSQLAGLALLTLAELDAVPERVTP